MEKICCKKKLSQFEPWQYHTLKIKNKLTLFHFYFVIIFIQTYKTRNSFPKSLLISCCMSHKTCEQFFCIRCIYVLPLAHHHKQNMLIQLPFWLYSMQVLKQIQAIKKIYFQSFCVFTYDWFYLFKWQWHYKFRGNWNKWIWIIIEPY